MNIKELKKEFEDVESRLLELIKNSEIKIDKKTKTSEILSSIKQHIQKVEEAKILLVKYEILAKQIQNFDDVDAQAQLEKSEQIENVTIEDNITNIKKSNIKDKTLKKSDKKKEKDKVL